MADLIVTYMNVGENLVFIGKNKRCIISFTSESVEQDEEEKSIVKIKSIDNKCIKVKVTNVDTLLSYSKEGISEFYVLISKNNDAYIGADFLE